ncbi:HD domain-containing phosphohydrolase [Marinobacter lipolyticus]|uniref:HD domain-containing phosphohydrolase n=1 Tax=Marinobacter lipolyticus TaxID=209639 RepID=UPI003A94D191
MRSRNDVLITLNQSDSLAEKLVHLHQVVRDLHPQITRVSIALYDKATDKVRTFTYSGKETPLNHYQSTLSGCHSLKELAESRDARLEQDLSVFSNSSHIHAQKIYQAGYRGSYTLPLFFDDELLGFIFFNTEHENAFDPACISQLNLVADLVALLIFNSFSLVRTLLSTVQSALDLTYSRDPETGAHLQRMSRYARIIARHVVSTSATDDQFPEYVYLFAPLHDIGKVAIPDSILFKPGKLTAAEFEVMKTHTSKGKAMAEKLLRNYRMGDIRHTTMLLNIIAHHHEAFDGSGYPDGLAGKAIPLEARIVTVADIFDALTSRRPYKEAWTVEESLAEIRALSGQRIDPECANALMDNLDEVLEIRETFQDADQ